MNAAAREATANVLAQWDEWSSRCTDALFDLDARVGAAGSADDRLDVAAAFLGRKAVAERIEEMRAASQRNIDTAAIAARPLVDETDAPVAADLSAGAALVDAIIAKVAARLDEVDRVQAAADRARVTTVEALAECERLVTELESDAVRLASMRAEVEAAAGDPAGLASAAAGLERLRDELRAADAERTRLLALAPGFAARVDELRGREAAVRQVVEHARAKVIPLPNLAVPSVDALEPFDAEAVAGLPWPAARDRLRERDTRLGRVAAAFDEVERRFAGPLARRDELRGLLQAYRGKAAANRLGEDPVLEPQYRAAADVLWSAPCDLTRADVLVAAYQHAVNAAIAAGGQRRSDAPRRSV